MQHRQDNQQQQRQQQLLTIADRGTAEELFKFLQGFHRRPFQNMTDALQYIGAIDEQIDFIDCTATRYNVTPLIIAAGKGSVEKTKILLVHGANPNKQCATGDTALNLAAHRQKYSIVDLLIQYKANPNLYNQAGKTALHRAVVSYNNENAHRIRTLLDAGADPHIEDRNQRIPLDEAVIANRTDVVDLLLSYDRTLIGRSYRSAIVAARLGYDKCLEILLNYGMDPNIADQTNITPLHIAVRYMKLTAVQFLINKGADPNLVNHRGETAISIAKSLPAEQRQNFLNVLLGTSTDVQSNKAGNALLQDYPLLRNHPNWTLDSDEFRSSTSVNSSVQNLLDLSNETYWCCPQSKNAWIIFDLKHQYKISGLRIIGCGNPSTPRDGHLDVSNALSGPWLQMKDFTCSITQDKKNDFFFPSFETRFIRIFFLNNHGSDEIRIQNIAFFGVDTRLLNLLEQFGLGKSLKTLLANNINDQETLLENQDEILNSSDKYLHINEHFQFIRLMQSLRSPQLTYLEWFIPPQTTHMAGEKLPTFSVAADEGLTNRVQLEEKLENSPRANIVLMKDLEPIQGRSLVDFSDYIIKSPGRYKIRVVSVDSPDIHTPWQEIVVGPISSSSRSLTSERDEHLYLSSTTHFFHDTTNDKDETSLSKEKLTTTITAALSSSNKENHASSTAKVYESNLDETHSSAQLISIKSIEDSPYDFSLTNMSTITDSSLVNYRPDQPYKPEHYTQTVASDFYDHSTNTLDDVDDGYDSSTRFNSKSTSEKYLTPTKYRAATRLPLQNILLYTGNGQPKQYDDDDDMVNYGDKIIIPTKYRLRQERINRLLANENRIHSRQPLQTAIEQDDDYEPEQLENGEISLQQNRPRSYDGQKSRKRTQPIEEPARQSPETYYEKIDLSNESTRSRDGSQSSARQTSRKHAPPVEEPVQQKHQASERLVPSRESSPEQLQNHRRESNRSPMPVESRDKSSTQQKQYSSRSDEQDQPRKRTHSIEEPVRQKSQQRDESSRESSTERVQRPVKSKYESLSRQNRQSSQQRADSDDESLPKTSQQSGKGQAQKQDLPIENLTSPKRTSNYEPRNQRNGFRRESSPPPPPQSQSNYYELELSPQRNGSVRESPSSPHRSKQRRTDLDDESPEEHAQYFGQVPSQNRNTSVPISLSVPTSRQHTNYESRILSQPLNDSSNNIETPHEEGGSNYYELEVSPERDVPLQKLPSTRRQRTDSGDESLGEHSEYYGQAPLKNRKTAANNEASPSNQQPPTDESQASARARRELTNRSPSLSQQQQQQQKQQQRSNYYELNRSSKRISSSRDSPVQRHATPYEEQQQSRRHQHSPSRTSTPPRVKQPASLRNGSTYERTNSPTYSDRRVGAPTISNHRSSPRQYEEHRISRRNDDQDPLNLLYNRYRIIDGDFELRENPSDESRSRQIQFLFKAILQGRDSDERENNIRHNPLLDRSAMNEDHRNENPIDSSDDRRAHYQKTSAQTNRPYSRRKNAQSSHGKNIDSEGRNASGDRVSSPHSPPSDPGAAHTTADGDSITTTRRIVQDTDQPQVPNQPRQPSSENEDINVTGLDGDSNAGSRKSLKTPPQPPRPRSKYYFGKAVDYSPVEDESDGADCEAFGHPLKPRPLNNAATKRNLDYSLGTNPRFPPDSNNTSSVDARFAYQNTIGTSVDDRITQQQRLPSPPQSTNGKTDRPMPDRQLSTNKPASQQVDRRASDDYINLTNYIDLNQNFSNETSSTAGFPRQYQDDANNYEENRMSNKKQEQPSPPNRFSQRTTDHQRARHVDDDQDDSPDDDDDDDIHDRMQNDRGDATYINEIDDDDDVDNQSAQDNESQHSSVHLPSSSSVNALLRQNPIRDVPTTVQPKPYPSGPQMRPSASVSTTGKDSKKGGGGFFGLFRGKKPLEISVRTADHSHQYTSGIIPPRLPSTPTTDTSDEIIERKPFDRAHKNHYSPDPFQVDSQDNNNDEDTEDSDSMSQVQLHNRDRLAQRQAGMKAGRDFGTQVDEKPTRTIGTMSEPIKTRNAGNEVQPQSSSTQTSNSRREQHEEHDEDVMDYRPSTSRHSRDDRQTNGHYPSYRSTSLDHRNKHISASSSAPKHRDHDDYDQHRPRHRSQYHNSSRDPYISARDRYHRDQSPPSPHRTPAPPAPYRSTSPNDRHRSPSPTSRYRFPSPQRSRSRQPPVSSSSQRRSRSPQRSTSPIVSKHRTPSPPLEYRSIKPDDYERSRKKDRPRMVSAGTNTSLDDIRSSSHQNHRSRSTSIERQYPSQSNYSNGFHRRSPTSDYQKLDSNPLKHADNTKQEFSEDNYRMTRNDEQSSTAKRYRIRPTRNDSYSNNRESSSSPLNHSSNRPKEYTPKIHTDDDHHRRSVSSSKSRRSDRDDRYLDNLPDERYLQELPKGGSVSIPSTTVIQPETISRSREPKKSSVPPIQDHFDRNRQIPQKPLHHAHERQASSDGSSRLLNFATRSFAHQPVADEVAIPFNIRYVHEGDEEFSMNDPYLRSSTWKHDDLRARTNQIVLLPVLNSSRTHILEKQTLRGGQHLRQSQTNGNFFLATSPTFHQFDSSANIDDSEQFIQPTTLRSEVA